MTEEFQRVPASLRRRLLAMVYDLILVFALVFCAAMLYAAIAKVLTGVETPQADELATGQVIHELEQIDLGWGFLPFCAMVAAGFYLYFWKKSGQTLGMRAWKIRLENHQVGELRYWQLISRLFFSVLSFLCFGLGYWFSLINKKKASVHDKLSQTWVSMPG